MEKKNTYELRRTSSLPIGRVVHSGIQEFNGLEIKYIGSCCDNINKKDNRDFILVREQGKSYYASNGKKLEWRLFYRSTGTSDHHSIRDGVWFPAYGWTLTSGGLLINKGLPYGYDKTGNKIQYYSGFGVPVLGLLSKFYNDVVSKLKYQRYTIKTFRDIIPRWKNDDVFKISALLGGGLWTKCSSDLSIPLTDCEDHLSIHFEYFRNQLFETIKNSIKKIYHTPTTQQFIPHYRINDIMSINNEYGVEFSKAAKLTSLLYKIVNHPRYNTSIERRLEEQKYNTHTKDYEGEDYLISITNYAAMYKNTRDHELSDKLRSSNLKLPFIEDVEILSQYPDIFNELVKDSTEILDSLNSQEGGNIDKVYNFITNPLTNRKVNINSNLGKKILKNYVNNYI